MKPWLFAALVTLCGTPLASAQTQDADARPSIDGFAGFSGNHFFYADSGVDIVNPDNLASNFSHRAQGPVGFDTSLTVYLNKYLGIAGDLSMYFNGKPDGQITTGQDFHVDSRSLYVMAGPEMQARNHTHLTPFVHALFGVARSQSDFNVPGISFSDSHTRTGSAMALGGGLDRRVSGRLSIRGMIDYTRTVLGNADPGESRRQNHYRISLGLLFHRETGGANPGASPLNLCPRASR
jgi:opacity protein-like surface antigen